MQRNIATKLFRAGRVPSTSSRISSTSKHLPTSSKLIRSSPTTRASIRLFSSTPVAPKGLSPESEDPQPKVAQEHDESSLPVPLSPAEYEELSEAYMDKILAKLEALQETNEEVDVEYSAGVLNLTLPQKGTYVINKQPPNKQIWLSSPISGPKRFDYVVQSEGQHAKADTGAGQWVYLRDGSSLGAILLEEVGVDVDTIEVGHD